MEAEMVTCSAFVHCRMRSLSWPFKLAAQRLTGHEARMRQIEAFAHSLRAAPGSKATKRHHVLPRWHWGPRLPRAPACWLLCAWQGVPVMARAGCTWALAAPGPRSLN